jgi:hypothetical protein
VTGLRIVAAPPPEPTGPSPRCARCGHVLEAHDEGDCAVNKHESATGPECECDGFVMPGEPASTFASRKAARREHYKRFIEGWKLRACSACAGSGRYDHDGAPPCGACGGTGRERYKPDPR